MNEELDDAIDRYRAEISAEAELSRADLDQLEDHLRELVAELRGVGVPLAEAIAHARDRLGDPRQVAREHAHVRSPFGARLSRARAWSAAALLSVPAVHFIHIIRWHTFEVVDLAAWIALGGAVTARRAWARTLVLGIVAQSLLFDAVRFGAFLHARGLTDYVHGELLATIAPSAAALVFLVPWRRAELGTRGAALALLGAAYAGMQGTLILVSDGLVIGAIGGPAIACAVAAIGCVLFGARWASGAAAMAGVAFAALAIDGFMFDGYGTESVTSLVMFFSGPGSALGALGSLAAAFVMWRSPRRVSHAPRARTL